MEISQVLLKIFICFWQINESLMGLEGHEGEYFMMLGEQTL